MPVSARAHVFCCLCEGASSAPWTSVRSGVSWASGMYSKAQSARGHVGSALRGSSSRLLPVAKGRYGPARTVEIENPRDGLAAMTQHGLGAYQMGQDAWRMAFGALIRATLHPTLENLSLARQALELLDAQEATRH